MKKHTQNNFIAYLAILASFFVLIFFTRNIYASMQQNLDTTSSQSSEILKAKRELSRLWDLQKDLSQEDSGALQEIKWFSGKFSDENIIDHIYSYAQEVNEWDERVIVRSLDLSAWEKSDLGFLKANVELEVVTSSEEALFSLMRFLIDEESEYRFYIENFEYDLGASKGNISVSIPLIYYYK